MALLTTAQEYAAIQEALQAFSQGKAKTSISIDGMTITYEAGQLAQLQSREALLAKRLSRKNQMKRTFPDFS